MTNQLEPLISLTAEQSRAIRYALLRGYEAAYTQGDTDTAAQIQFVLGKFDEKLDKAIDKAMLEVFG